MHVFISWNMNGVQHFNKLKTLQKMAGSCQPLFILIQESHSNSECDLDLIRKPIEEVYLVERQLLWKEEGSAHWS